MSKWESDLLQMIEENIEDEKLWRILRSIVERIEYVYGAIPA